ncbi:MAG: hypothetical protein JJE17_08210 [Peptostreptococcaceae bacterium]|nr:hypothetical protein [Peptostreptococcaceae bacterium]
MKKLLLLTFAMTIILSFVSCSSSSSSQENNSSTESLNKSIDELFSVNSIYYTVNFEQILKSDTDTITTTNTSKIKLVNEPYVTWSEFKNSVSHTNTKKTETITEMYQKATEDGLELLYRGDSSSTDWQKNIIDDKTIAEKYIENTKNNMKAEHYILSANLDSFKMEKKQDGLIKYNGTISQSSVVEAYKKYLRNFYVDAGLIKSEKELSNKEMLKEISSGEIAAVTVGIPSLALTDKPIPVTFWVNEKNNKISKVEIDKINATQALLDMTFEGSKDKMPKVEKAILTYEVLEINTFDEIPIPQ